MSTIAPGDLVLARGSGGTYHAVVRSTRLGRLVVERLDGRPAGPVSVRDVVTVFKNAGPPESAPAETPRLRPTAQLRLDLE